MNVDALLSALDLPAGSRVDKRVPKKMLLENGAPTTADKRIINDGIEELLWLATLKPTTIGVPEYRDEVREYLEIVVLRLTLRVAAKATRLAFRTPPVSQVWRRVTKPSESRRSASRLRAQPTFSSIASKRRTP